MAADRPAPAPHPGPAGHHRAGPAGLPARSARNPAGPASASPPATTPPTLVPSPPAAVQAVRFALGQVGKSYRWGAAGPGAEQWRWLHDRGQDVAGGALQPGDLLVYAATPHDPSSIHHVALAVGAGRMVEAAAPGAPVRVVPVRWAGLVGADRPVP